MVKKNVLALWIAAVIFVADQAVKYILISTIGIGNSLDVIPKIFSFSIITNEGITFGLFQGNNILFAFVTLIIIGVILFFYHSIPKASVSQVGIGCILGGALGNLTDRIFRGAVVDFINVHVWPIFNLADCAISIGVVLLIYQFSKED